MKTISAVVVVFGLSSVALGQNEADLWARYEHEIRVDPRNSLTNFRLGELYLEKSIMQSAALSFRDALHGSLRPGWVEVWSHVNLGKVFDATGQRDRAINEYTQAQRTNDNTRGALDEVAIYMQSPYPQQGNARSDRLLK